MSVKKVIVVGQGYVGLPVSIRAVEVGFDVIGIDLDLERVSRLRSANSYVEDISNQALASALDSGRYLPTSDYADTAGFDIAVITVPTPLRESLPDLSFIENSGTSLALHLRAGSTVILESTTYPGTTEELLVPILEAGSGLTAGKDFHVGYSPERIDPGNKAWGFVETPKVVSGIDETSLKVVNDFYSTLVNSTVPVSGTKEAELTKLLENTFRHVNIALVNELAIFAHQLDVNIWESIDAAATKPFGYMKFTPGPGVGGHCLPVDPSYLSWQVKKELGQNFRFIELANDVNEHMPAYIVQRAIEILNSQKKALNGSRIIILGVAYKKNSSDSRESPTHHLIELLKGYGAEVRAVDPYVDDRHWPNNVEKIQGTLAEMQESELVILVTDHDSFDYDNIAQATADGRITLLDTRNRLRSDSATRL